MFEDSLLVSPIEAELAGNVRFGNCDYINALTQKRYALRLKVLSEFVPTAAALVRAFEGASFDCRYRVFGDPTLRWSINALIAHFKFDLPCPLLAEAEAVLNHAEEYLSAERLVSPLVDCDNARLGSAIHHGAIWNEQGEDSPSRRIFHYMFANYVSGKKLQLCTPDDSTVAVLRSGAELLAELFPNLARSALSHVHVIAVVDNLPNNISKLQTASLSLRSFPATTFLAAPALKNPWTVAEHLLHEALHLKQIDLEISYTILRRGYSPALSARVYALWNRREPHLLHDWPVDRALGAFHVYSHLGLYFQQVERHAGVLVERYGPLGALEPSKSARESLDRAHYLGWNLLAAVEELGSAGHDFVLWLQASLDRIDDSPPSPEAIAHLLLDRYEYEVCEFEALYDAPLTQANRDMLSGLLGAELDMARRIGAAIGRSVECPPELAQIAETANRKEAIHAFKQARGAVLLALRSVPPEHFCNPCDFTECENLGRYIQKVVDDSDARLYALMVPQVAAPLVTI